MQSTSRTGIMLFFFLLGATALAQQFSVLPQVAVGGGFSGEIVVTNQGYDPASVTLDFLGDDGLPLNLLIDSQAGSQSNFNLNPGQSRSFLIESVDAQDPATPGYAVLTFPEDVSIRSTLILKVQREDGSLQTQLGVAQQLPNSDFSFAAEVDSARGINTGLALANGRFPATGTPDPRAEGFIVSLIRSDGQVQDSAILNLGLGEHTSLFLDDARLFPGLDNFNGTVSVSGGIDFGCLALRLESLILSSLSIDAGPNFGAFDFSDTVAGASEVEPNDTPAQAQALTLPARITGIVEAFAASDLFQFEGNQGDILTVFTLTGTDSGLDSFLTLERPDGTLISFSDQNGLLRRNDSFIRMVLPETGTFILRVEDFFFGGGPGFSYDIAVRVE